jgi:hypothetical protein
MTVLSVLLLPCAVATLPQEKVAPNILIILTDDQGWGDLDYNCENSTCVRAHICY